MNTAVHEITEACQHVHCRIHDTDEDAVDAYRVCFECNHVYPDGRALVAAYNAGVAEVNARAALEPPPLPGWREIDHPVPRIDDPAQAWFCPLCSHNF